MLAATNQSQFPKVSDYICHYAALCPEREALVTKSDRLTYLELDRRITICAKALQHIGIQKGDRVATLSYPGIEFLVIFLAATRIGAIWLGLNPKFSVDECRYVIGDACPKVLFSIVEFEDRNYSSLVTTLKAEFPCLETIVALEESLPVGQTFEAFINGGFDGETLPSTPIDPKDPALLVYTSGSSGKPKGALLSHYSLCRGAEIQNEHFGVLPPRLICNFPINHVAGVADTCCIGLVAGGTLFLQPRFSTGQVLEVLRHEPVNMLMGVPTMFLMLLDEPGFTPADFAKLDVVLWGGAAMPESTIKRLQALVPRLMNAYGSTETACNVLFTPFDATLEELRDSVGRPTPHIECRIANEAGYHCEALEQGELQFKAETLFMGYFNRPEANQMAYTEDGWFRSGDIGFWREDGCISLVGRMSDMFKSGGYNVYPREIETLLERHPQVEMAAVVGVPDELYQEVGAAFIMVSDSNTSSSGALTEQTINDFCRQHLANYKIPKSFTIVEQLPMLATGKVDKVLLKNNLWSGSS